MVPITCGYRLEPKILANKCAIISDCSERPVVVELSRKIFTNIRLLHFPLSWLQQFTVVLLQVIDNVPGKIVHNKLLAGPCSGKKVG